MIKKLTNYWKYNLKHKVRYWQYKLLYGVDIDIFHGTIAANFGNGKFVSVKKNGPYIEITAHKRMNKIPTGMIRLIPVQYNHGIMVEYHNDYGNIMWRTHCDYDMLYKMGNNEREELL